MARPFLVIDGYNLMHTWGLARQRYGPGDLERLRERFLRELAGQLFQEDRQRTTVVFDAGEEAPTDVAVDRKFESMRILFAVRDTDADTRIEKLIAGHSAPRQIRVVSSDRRLQVAARRRRGQFVTSEDFIGELRRGRSETVDQEVPRELEAKSTGETTEAEMAEWLEIFGDADDL